MARLIPFQQADEQAYMLEFTSGKMRVYKDGVLVVSAAAVATITGLTIFEGGTYITVADSDALANGDHITITGIADGSTTELNGREFVLADKASLTLELLDPVSGAKIVGTGFAAYVPGSGGSVFDVYEIATPYLAADLADIAFAQTFDTMYIDHYKYTPRKLTIDATGVWTLATYTRTADPFTASGTFAVTYAAHYATAQAFGPAGIYISPAVGATAISGAVYTLSGCEEDAAINGNSYRVQSSNYYGTTYWVLYNPTTGELAAPGADAGIAIAGGLATAAVENPIALAFYESRLIHAGTNRRPTTLFLSCAPSDTGASRFDVFTGATDLTPDDALFFGMAPVNGSVAYIVWAGGTNKHLLIGTFGGVFRVSGGGFDEPITPTSINIRQLDAFGCEAVPPALNGSQVFFIQRGGGTLRGVRYSQDADDLVTVDMCLNADQIGTSPLKRVVLQTAKPDVVWVVREDGILAGLTVQNAERIAGWHRHKIGGTNAKVIDIATLPRPGLSDQIYIVAERTIDGVTSRSVEVMYDDVLFPDVEDFYSTEDNFETDRLAYRGVVYRQQAQYVHMDSAASYDGSDRGVAAAATLTPGATAVTVGSVDVAFTASADVFTAADVGKQIWRQPDAVTGLGAGRAEITSYVDATDVLCTITEAFNAVTAIPAGDWFFAVDEVAGLSHLEGETVAVVLDGAVHADGKTGGDYETVTVADGKITLTAGDPLAAVFAAVIHVGLPYDGLLQTHNLELGGRTGPAQTKPRNICDIGIRFLHSLGCEYGTSLYKTEQIVHRDNTMSMDRPVPVFSGIKKLHYSDQWSGKDTDNEKLVSVAQRLPLPCVVQFVDVTYESGEDEE